MNGAAMQTENFDLTDVDGYTLRHLSQHLCLAGRIAELHRLLALDHQVTDSGTVNLWFAAQERANNVVGYLGDLALARADAAASTDRDLRCHLPPAALALEIRYALMAASVASSSNNVSTELLGQVIGAGIWSAERGLDHAYRLADPAMRFNALFAALPHITEGERPTVLSSALTAVSTIKYDWEKALISIGRQLRS